MTSQVLASFSMCHVRSIDCRIVRIDPRVQELQFAPSGDVPCYRHWRVDHGFPVPSGQFPADKDTYGYLRRVGAISVPKNLPLSRLSDRVAEKEKWKRQNDQTHTSPIKAHR